MESLPAATWQHRARAHAERVDALTAGHRARSGRPHPVEDFLFTYYSHRPAQLRRWSPGPGVVLEGHPVEAPPWVEAGAGAVLGPVKPAVRRTASFVAELLSRTARRPAALGCFGLHEWAMVYQGERRHPAPLRLGDKGTDQVVRSLPVRCSHFDAFRFFTDSAKPLNALQPTRESQLDLEQPGCLHAGMDLYKWAYKLSPWIESELVADCFELAHDIRVLDMQASPYDLADLGYEPVRIETAEGRATYTERQRAFAERAAPLRERLLTAARTCSC